MAAASFSQRVLGPVMRVAFVSTGSVRDHQAAGQRKEMDKSAGAWLLVSFMLIRDSLVRWLIALRHERGMRKWR